MKMLQYDGTAVSDRIDIDKADASKEYIFLVIGILRMLLINFNHIFAMVAMLYQ